MYGDESLEIGFQISNSLARWRRQVRLIQLLDATEKADLNPLHITTVHALAYFSNVLSPIWDLRPQDGKILKRRGGPYYPELQGDLDRLVGKGVVRPCAVNFSRDEWGVLQLDSTYELHEEFARPILRTISDFQDEERLAVFLRELAYAVAALSPEEFRSAMEHDVTYSKRSVAPGYVIDFAEWVSDNASERVAKRFDDFLPLVEEKTAPGEKLQLYVRYLDRVANA